MSSRRRGTGQSANATNTNTYEYGRFDPCSNTWERTSLPLSNEARSLIGWDGSGFAFRSLSAYSLVHTPGLGLVEGDGMRLGPDASGLEAITETFTSGIFIVYPAGMAPAEPPIFSSYFNGARDGTRAFVWGQPLPSDDNPEPAAVGFMLDPGSLTWREVSAAGAPSLRHGHSVIAAGDRFVVWGGRLPGDTAPLNDGAFYDPATDSWEAISTQDAPPGGSAQLHWVAERLVVGPGGAGGVYEPAQGWVPLEPLDSMPNPKQLVTADGRLLFASGLSLWLLDVATASWSGVPVPTGATGLQYEPAFFHLAWTGSTVLLWGSSVPQSCNAPEGVTGCDLVDPFLPAGEGVMVRIE